MVIPATKWRTMIEASVPSKALQWKFLAITTIMDLSNQSSGSVLNAVTSGGIPHGPKIFTKTPSTKVVFMFEHFGDAPLWPSLTWERATQLSITLNSQQEALNGAVFYLVQL